MAKYTLPESKAVRPQENAVPAFQLKVTFDRGVLSGYSYLAGGLNGLWSLVGLAASDGDDFVFEVSREDVALALLGCCVQGRFCLFHHKDEKTISFLNAPEIDFDDLDLIEVVDERWPLVFFLPRCALFSFHELVEIGSNAFLQGGLPCVTEFPQTITALGLSREQYGSGDSA